MKCFGFKIYIDEDGDVVPSSICDVEVDDKDTENIDKEPVIAVTYPDKEEVWFLSKKFDLLEAYAMGMSFATILYSVDGWKTVMEEK
uniref:Uncharacterized protein n=1 Tax=viral metagenome TaxID=1070528 RepID=A0A6M3IMQ4_9ZZZZ